MPENVHDWIRVARLELDLELTQKIMVANGSRESDGGWPETIPGIEASRCPGAQWRYRVNAEGEVAISFQADPSSIPFHFGRALPLCFSNRPGLCSGTRR